MRRDPSPGPPPGAPCASLARGTDVLVLTGPIRPGDVVGLCDRVRALLAGVRPGSVVCDVGALGEPDATTLEALARLQLTARQLGRRLCFRGARRELREMVELSGLDDVLPCGEPSAVEVGRQAEQGEQAGRIEEERDPDDLAT